MANLFKSRSAAFITVSALSLALALGTVDDSQAKSKKKGWLGVEIQEMTPTMRRDFDLGSKTGLLVTHVVRRSPADDAGLREEDIILQFDGQNAEFADVFSKLVGDTEPKSTASLLISRNGSERSLDVTIGRLRNKARSSFVWSGDNFSFGGTRLGIRVHELNEDLAEYFKVEEDGGVLISSVVEDSPAEAADLKAGDVITALDDEEIASPDDLVEAIAEYDAGDIVTVKYVRKGEAATMEVELDDGGFGDLFFGNSVIRRLPSFRAPRHKTIIQLRDRKGSI